MKNNYNNLKKICKIMIKWSFLLRIFYIIHLFINYLINKLKYKNWYYKTEYIHVEKEYLEDIMDLSIKSSNLNSLNLTNEEKEDIRKIKKKRKQLETIKKTDILPKTSPMDMKKLKKAREGKK